MLNGLNKNQKTQRKNMSYPKYSFIIFLLWISIHNLNAQQSDIELVNVYVPDTVGLGCDMPMTCTLTNNGPDAIFFGNWGLSFNIGTDNPPIDLTTVNEEFFASLPPLLFEVGDTVNIPIDLPIQNSIFVVDDNIEFTTKNVIIVWASTFIPEDEIENNYKVKDVEVTEGIFPEPNVPMGDNIELEEMTLEEEELPSNVIDYLNDNYPDEDIDEIELEYEQEEENEGVWIIKVELESGEELIFDVDGTFLYEEEEIDNFDDLPSNIQTFLEDSPTYDADDFEDAEWTIIGNNLVVYNVYLDDDDILVFDTDGNFLGEIDDITLPPFTTANLPENTTNFIATNYTSTIDAVFFNQDNNTPYQVILANETILFFDATGNFAYEITGDEIYTIEETDFPQEAITYLQDNYPNNTITTFYLSNDLSCNLSYVATLDNDTNVVFDDEGTFVVIDDSFTSIQSLATLGIKCVPNPAKEYIELQGHAQNNIESIEIVDSYGRKIFKTTNVSQRINIGAINNGIYFICLESKGYKYISKIEILH